MGREGDEVLLYFVQGSLEGNKWEGGEEPGLVKMGVEGGDVPYFAKRTAGGEEA